MGKRKRHGHFCWSCERVLANEKFSGKGHRRHLCKQCSRLDKDELQVRQALRNLYRCLGPSGRVHRKKRAQFQRFLSHANERVRRAAEEMQEFSSRGPREAFEGKAFEDEAFEDDAEMLFSETLTDEPWRSHNYENEPDFDTYLDGDKDEDEYAFLDEDDPIPF